MNQFGGRNDSDEDENHPRHPDLNRLTAPWSRPDLPSTKRRLISILENDADESKMRYSRTSHSPQSRKRPRRDHAGATSPPPPTHAHATLEDLHQRFQPLHASSSGYGGIRITSTSIRAYMEDDDAPHPRRSYWSDESKSTVDTYQYPSLPPPSRQPHQPDEHLYLDHHRHQERHHQRYEHQYHHHHIPRDLEIGSIQPRHHHAAPARLQTATSAAPMASAPTLPPGWRPIANASQNITFEMLRDHFSKPLKDAANHFGVCTTLLKKICRKNGIQSWPYRQIVGLRKSIASMEQQVQYFDGDQKRQYAEQLRKLQVKLESYIRTGQAPSDDADSEPSEDTEAMVDHSAFSVAHRSTSPTTEQGSSYYHPGSRGDLHHSRVMTSTLVVNFDDDAHEETKMASPAIPDAPTAMAQPPSRPLPSIAFILNRPFHSPPHSQQP
ncbi:hypothetical protein PINS_up005279 [Pythium insidiosum]|nr:hypothetical protein PINS_up005279 [Pythium insidiosum]